MSSSAVNQNNIAQIQQEWEEKNLKISLDRMPESRGQYTTVSLKPIKGLYTPADLADGDFQRDINFPGAAPYTRGIHPTGYRARLWTMRQFAGFGSAFDTNARFKYLLAHGQTG